MFTAPLAFGTMGLAAGGSCIPPAGTPSEGTGLAVSIKGCLFGPAILHAPVGGTVTWTNDDFLPHAVAGLGWSANDDPFGTFSPGASIRHTFDAPGIYTYMCHLHPGMSGIVIVGDVAFPPAPPPPTLSAPAVAAPRSVVPPIEAPLAGALVAFAAVGGYALARWPRRWRLSGATVRAFLADRRDEPRGYDQTSELPVGDDGDRGPDRPGQDHPRERHAMSHARPAASRYRLAMDRLPYDDDTAFTLADDASTAARIARTVAVGELRAKRFGEWTAVEVLGHVADMAEVFAERVRRVIAEDRPRLASVDQDKIAAERRNDERAPMELSKRIQAAHAELVRLLMDRANRSRVGVHEEQGEVDAGHLGAYHARHAHEHVSDLASAFPPSR
ncbi:MAG TPA: DinB family protein [Candidatus Limnocylindria bacterium]|nr:DinB family protein [Candidatus Limnocylindria bacterium]